MANKMISEEELRDEFLSAMIRSEEPLQAPEGFADEVMKRISNVPSPVRISPYSPPLWLKWGIPGIIILCLIGLLVSGQAEENAGTQPVVSLLEKTSAALSSWFTGFNIDFKFPGLNISGTTLWILGGGIILTWSFLLLFRFLEKRARQ